MDIPVHPLFKKLSAEQMASATTFCGYVGPGSTSEYIKLYPRLDVLAGSFEVATKDILHFEKAPESLLPFGGVAVWLTPGAKVISSHVKEGTTLAEPEKEFDETNSGRLRIRVRRELRSEDCSSTNCASRCRCSSRCCIIRPPT
jgi:hypothetical protein